MPQIYAVGTRMTDYNFLSCPICGSDDSGLHQESVEVWNRKEDDLVSGIRIGEVGELTVAIGENPSLRRNGIRIEYSCERCSCDVWDDDLKMFTASTDCRPRIVAALLLWQHKGTSFISWEIIPSGLYGPDVHPTPAPVLERNLTDQYRGTRRQIAFIGRLCAKKGIDQAELICLGIQEGRIHPNRVNLVKSALPNALEQLTRPEVGALFAFRDWLKGDV